MFAMCQDYHFDPIAIMMRNMNLPDLSSYREHFPVTKNLIYLNHAAVAPLSAPAAKAMEWLVKDALENGSRHYSDLDGNLPGHCATPPLV